MAWQQLEINELSLLLAEALTELLEAHGALAVTQQPYQPLWSDQPQQAQLIDQQAVLRLQVLFEPSVDCHQIEQDLKAFDDRLLFTWQTVADQNWQSQWQRTTSPVQVGRRLWICPSHCPQPPKASVCVRLDPGLAFGTGTHPTTGLCLAFLDEHLCGQESVCDYGSGSGILAIAAIKLGAARAFAVDNDPQALIAARGNVAHNGLSSTQILVQSPEEFHASAVDIVVANILAQPLTALSHRFRDCLRPGGQCILSGLLEHQVDEVISHYHDWADISEVTCREGWARTILYKRA